MSGPLVLIALLAIVTGVVIGWELADRRLDQRGQS